MTSDWSRVLKLKCLSADSYEVLRDESFARRRFFCFRNSRRHSSHQNLNSLNSQDSTEEPSSSLSDIIPQDLKTEPNVGKLSRSNNRGDSGTSAGATTNKAISNSVISNPNPIQSTAIIEPNNQSSSSSSSSVNTNPILSFIGKHLNKSSTRHLEKNSSGVGGSSQSRYQSNSDEKSQSSEARYTKFPVSCVSETGHCSTTTSKRVNQINQIPHHHRHNIPNTNFEPEFSHLPSFHTNSFPREKLNSVQSGDHTTVQLPWTDFIPNNLSCVTKSKVHENTHRNIIVSSSESIKAPSRPSKHPYKQRSRSLERNNNFRVNPSLTLDLSSGGKVTDFSLSREPRSWDSRSEDRTKNPPSPPPRPPSTLKHPSSRLINRSNTFSYPGPELPPKNNIVSSKMNSSANFCTQVPLPSSSTESRIPQSVEFQTTAFGGAGNFNSLRLGTNPSGIVSVEDVRNSGFINKPTQGWLHADQLLTREGVSYTVRYIGCLDVNMSMKSLDFDTRSLIAKECINQVCESAGLKSIDRKRKIDRRLIRVLGLRPRLENAGSDVRLTITSTSIKLTSLENGAVIAVHDMPNISFASGGDVTMLDFIAYVAKDAVIGRACFVLECGSGIAQDVITTVGQAFELRFKEYLQKRPAQQPRLRTDDPEYYNDLPGKVPPEVQNDTSAGVNEKAKVKNSSASTSSNAKVKSTPTLTLPTSDKVETNVNLIDFEAPTPPAFGPQSQDKLIEGLILGVNPIPTVDASKNKDIHTDPFDMQPFAAEFPKQTSFLSSDDQRAELEREPWFHGAISRSEAESLVLNDGDFLVRESQTSVGQFVLTGMHNGATKHLLLVDPEGVIRTKDQVFESVTHLVRHHSDSNRPIISIESMLLLRNPVLKHQ